MISREQLRELFSSYLIMQSEAEVWWLLKKLKKVKPLETIVEIGISPGSVKLWEQVLRKGGIYIGVDSTPNLDFKLLKFWDYRKSDRKIQLLEGDCREPETKLKVQELLRNEGKAIDFLYIDTRPTHSDVAAAYHNFKDLVRKGGVIGFHDIGNEDVFKFFNSLNGEKDMIQIARGIGIYYV
ncbi:MAG: class I SAM-dependent methyltransferase [Methanocellales archaeon]